MNDFQDHHDAQLAEPTTFAPPLTDAWVFVQKDCHHWIPLAAVTSAADFFFAESLLAAAGRTLASYHRRITGELGDIAFVTIDDVWGVEVSTTPTAAATTYCVKVIRHMDDVNY